jgi:predicted nucleic acid-binding Zn ribbon protein
LKLAPAHSLAYPRVVANDRRAFSSNPKARGPSTVASVFSESPILSAHSAHITLADWQRAVGERLAQKTHPERVNDGVLTVRVPSSTWAQELSFLSEAVLERLGAAGHRIQKLRFHVAGTKAPIEAKVTIVRRVALPAALAASLARIDDPELREAIAEAASLSLARKSH